MLPTFSRLLSFIVLAGHTLATPTLAGALKGRAEPATVGSATLDGVIYLNKVRNSRYLLPDTAEPRL